MIAVQMALSLNWTYNKRGLGEGKRQASTFFSGCETSGKMAIAGRMRAKMRSLSFAMVGWRSEWKNVFLEFISFLKLESKTQTEFILFLKFKKVFRNTCFFQFFFFGRI